MSSNEPNQTTENQPSQDSSDSAHVMQALSERVANLERAVGKARDLLAALEAIREKAQHALQGIEEDAKEATTAKGQAETVAVHVKALETDSEALVEEIGELKARAENEARLADQAKKFTEEHSNFVYTKRGELEAQLSALSTMRKEVDNIIQDMRNSRASVEGEETAVSNARKNVETSLSAITAAKTTADGELASIETVKKTFEETRSSIFKMRETAQADLGEISGNKVLVLDAAKAAQAAQNTINENLLKTTHAKEGATKLLEDAEKQLSQVKALASVADDVNRRVGDYEKKLEALQAKFSETRKAVEDLLPGATSAGLASAFRKQRLAFVLPKLGWLLLFIASIAGLVLLGTVVLWERGSLGFLIDKQPPPMAAQADWGDVVRFFLQRLAVAAPLIWLAVLSARNYKLGSRLSDEYAFKEALSATFEGYKTQMAEISRDPKLVLKDAPLMLLCHNILRILSENPTRVYDAKLSEDSPLQVVQENMTAVLNESEGARLPGTEDRKATSQSTQKVEGYTSCREVRHDASRALSSLSRME